MKKIYSHVTACPQDPSSVIAAFFFTARGNEIEKSPIGLFRTLLHRLCQQISALRDLVVRAYVAKRRLLTSNWQWRIGELKDFLAAVVTPSVLGQRSLLLFVDALDECDFAATQSVIRVFEDLATSSLSKGTNFSICLSSRYWPQFKIQNCFITRVELENKGDVLSYIQKYLEPSQFDEDPELHAALRTEILDKAKGTFLWVVLVTRELLQAITTGATLRELRDIVDKVPPDLDEFYQHQLQNTKSEDRERMLRLLQLVFYAQRPLSLTEVRYALAFGCKAYTSYAEWCQSSEYVKSDKQMEKRIREYSKGLIEIAPLPNDDYRLQYSDSDRESAFSKRIFVQFIHQSVRDFLILNGFSYLHDSRRQTQIADGHEFFKTVCFNYLRIKDFEAISAVDLRVKDQFCSRSRIRMLVDDPQLLEYAVQYLFQHAAQAERHGISQDDFRTYICSNIQGFFERWRCLNDSWNPISQGSQARPIHVLAQYGLLTRAIAEQERSIDIVGGFFCSALTAACWAGHEDAVQILLECGADPRFSAPIESSRRPWEQPMAPFRCAVARQHLPVLHQLLDDRRSSLTLEERIGLASTINDEQPHLESFLALLFPEAIFPDSVIENVCEAAGESALGTFSFLLDKSPHAIVHEEYLWHCIFWENHNTFMVDKIRILLDRGGTINVTWALADSLDGNDDVSQSNEVCSLLLEHCHVEITEYLIDRLSYFEDASQIICTLEAAGYRIDPFTPKQLSLALQYGSVKTVAFFLQRKYCHTSADEMLNAALRNEIHGDEVTRLLLGYLNPGPITEQAVVAAFGNHDCGDALIRLLYTRSSSLIVSEAALVVAVTHQPPNTIQLILERCEHIDITERILTAAVQSNRIWLSGEECAEKFDLLLRYDPDIRIQESTVITAIDHEEGALILNTICRHDKPLFCSQNVVAAAANSDSGPDALDFVLQQDRDAKISSSMIMIAIRAKRGAALISVMIHHDHTIVIEKEHLVAAASNPYDPRTIFAFLDTKGKLGSADAANEILHTGPAKRRRISRQSSPHISINVINAAFSNRNEGPRLQLLELFVEWGVITAADLENGIYNAPTRSRNSLCLPSISQLFPGI